MLRSAVANKVTEYTMSQMLTPNYDFYIGLKIRFLFNTEYCFNSHVDCIYQQTYHFLSP